MVKVSRIAFSGIMGVSLFSAVMAHASFFDDKVDARESAEAVIHCAEEAKQLLGSENEYLSNITAKHKKVSADTDTKRYTFTTASSFGGLGGPPPTQGPTLHVDVQVTQQHTPPGVASGGIRSSIKWVCSIE